MEEEHLEVGTGGMMTTEEAGTAMKTDMTDGMIGHGAPGMITLGTIIGVMTEVLISLFMEQTLEGCFSVVKEAAEHSKCWAWVAA